MLSEFALQDSKITEKDNINEAERVPQPADAWEQQAFTIYQLWLLFVTNLLPTYKMVVLVGGRDAF